MDLFCYNIFWCINPNSIEMKKIALLIASILIFSVITSGCSTINENSENYSEHSLKYLVNTSEYGEDEEVPINEITNALKNRLSKFEVKDVEINHSNDNGEYFVTAEFGTIDDVNDIKKWLELDTTFNIKKKIIDESDFETIIKNKAEAALEEVKKEGSSFEMVAQNNAMIDPERVFYSRSNYMYKNEIKNAFIEPLFSLGSGEIKDEVVYYVERPFALANPLNIAAVIKLFDKRENEKVIKHKYNVHVSHILIAYKGGIRAADTIERTQEEALELAKEVKEKLDKGESFESLALKHSDDESNKKSGGLLEVPAGDGTYVAEFEDAALNELTEVDQTTNPVETPFGYHLIMAREINEAYEESMIEEQVNFGVIFFAQKPVEWELTTMDGDFINNTGIIFDENYKPFIEVRLSAEGKDLLQNLTEENSEEILGVFVGNELITSFTVKEVNGSGIITVKTPANTTEADIIKEKFDLAPLPAPIIFIEDSVEPVEEAE